MKLNKKCRQSNLQWFSVKLIMESIISGDVEPNTIDMNYTKEYKTFEESIILIRAQSFEDAYKIAEGKGKKAELSYINPYGETVNWRFVQAIDCFSLFVDSLYSGTELYSRFLRVSINTDIEQFLDRYYPDTIEDSSSKDLNYIIRNQDFNKPPNS